jgi:hypothetical protein
MQYSSSVKAHPFSNDGNPHAEMLDSEIGNKMTTPHQIKLAGFFKYLIGCKAIEFAYLCDNVG